MVEKQVNITGNKSTIYAWTCSFNCAAHANDIGPNYIISDVIAYLLRRLFLCIGL